jgi:alpha-L-fucosidase
MKQLTTVFTIFYLTGIFLMSCKNQPEEGATTNDQALSSEQRLEWFREAKFGMFIHWGPYSLLAGEWNGRTIQVGRNAEWIMKFLTIPVNEYREIAHDMNPVKFNAHEWVKLAKATGMKYIVITAKHHDGFAMYKSEVSPYNIVDWTPFKRDPLKELAQACAQEGIIFGVYYSHREDWDHPGGYGNDWDYDNDWGQDFYNREKFEHYLEEKAKPQIRELLTHYGPLGLVWFDRGMYTQEQGEEFVRLVRQHQPSALINSRVGHYNQELLGDFQEMADKGIPPGGLDEYFQTPQTLNETWGYSKFDTLWKDPETVIRQLVQVVSLGGNYLLNIGPEGNGEIPDRTIKIFAKVGSWLERNAESIYGTRANPFGELDWGYCTVKENKLYLFVRDWPVDNELSLTGLQNSVTSAYLLIDKSVKLTVVHADNKTRIILPSKVPDDPITVLVLETDGTPKVDPQMVLQDETGKMEFNYLTAITSGKTKTRFNRKGGFHVSKWTAPEDAAEWVVFVNKPGKFKVDITYAANNEWGGMPFEISIGESHIKKTVIPTGNLFEFQEFPIGFIALSEAGKYTLTMRPKASGENYLMYLRSINLKPVESINQSGWGVD